MNLAELPTPHELDLVDVDLRGRDLRRKDLRHALHIVLRELVDCDDQGAWVPLAAWDDTTRFPAPVEERLCVLGLMDADFLHDEEWQREARERGRLARSQTVIDKSIPGCSEVEPGWWADG